MTSTIESRTIEHRVWLSAADVAEALRDRAAEYDADADALGDPVPDDCWDTAVACRVVAQELRERADVLDCAVIEHLSE